MFVKNCQLPPAIFLNLPYFCKRQPKSEKKKNPNLSKMVSTPFRKLLTSVLFMQKWSQIENHLIELIGDHNRYMVTKILTAFLRLTRGKNSDQSTLNL